MGLVGAGLIAQADHAYYLWEERERFELVAVAAPSVAAREGVGRRYGVPELHDGIEGLLGLGLDGIVIAAPDAVHADIALAALDAGIHVLCEKPLAQTVADASHIADRGEATGKVVQVGTMKRFDPAYERLLELLPDAPEDVLTVSIEVHDPGFAPFIDHLPWSDGRDQLPAVAAELRARTAVAAALAAGREVSADELHAFGGFVGSLVHNVNEVAGICAHYGLPVPATPLSAATWDRGSAVELSAPLPGGGRARLAHLRVPGVADYRERVTVYCTDQVLELEFPSPYLRHHPTRLTVRSGTGPGLEQTDVRVSYEEAFRSELRAFHAAVVDGAPVRCTAREAVGDLELLTRAFALAVGP